MERFHRHATLCIAAYGFLVPVFPPLPAPASWTYAPRKFRPSSGDAAHRVRAERHNPHSIDTHCESSLQDFCSNGLLAVPLVTLAVYDTVVLGVHAAKKATRFEALEPLRQAARDYCGGFRAGAAAGIRSGHDHSSQYVSDDYQAEIAFLGMESSPSFARQPECNGCVERFIRTLKEQLMWIRLFQNIEDLRHGLAEFRERYNQCWIVQRLGYLTPAQARQQLLAIGAGGMNTLSPVSKKSGAKQIEGWRMYVNAR